MSLSALDKNQILQLKSQSDKSHLSDATRAHALSLGTHTNRQADIFEKITYTDTSDTSFSKLTGTQLYFEWGSQEHKYRLD
jgi:hypothetical protein